MRKTICSISILALIIVLIINLFPAGAFAAAESTSTAINIAIGSDVINVDGVKIKTVKSFSAGKTIYIPLRAVFEALGAEVDWIGNGKVIIIFRNVSVELSIGKNKITQNQAAKTLNAPPILKKGSIMVPLELLQICFDNYTKVTVKNKEIVITLKNDGALSDLSFLTGSIVKGRIGNSYFGWSIDVPKGSRVSYQSFNSKSIQIDNEQRNIGIDISITLRKDRTLKEYYNEIIDTPETILNGQLLDSNINLDASPAYIELLYSDEYDEAIYQRIILGNKYFYNVSVLSFTESNPEILSNDRYIKSIFDSFRLGYKGGLEDTADMSCVQSGLAEYSNYIASDSGDKKYSSWQMNIIPEWDMMNAYGDSPYRTRFGLGTKEYADIEISSANGQTDVEEYGNNIEEFYLSNFNPSLFKLEKSEASSIAGLNSYHLLYSVQIGKKKYSYDESFLIADGMVYDISFKAPASDFEKELAQYKNMLDTFKPVIKDAPSLVDDMEKYKYNTEKKRIGKDESPVTYENDKYNWSIEIPGNWMKNSTQGQSLESFYNNETGSIIFLEAADKKLVDSDIPDSKKFSSFRAVLSLDLDPVSVESVKINGMDAKKYKYRIEDEENEDYSDIYYYTFEGEAYYYCFMSSVSDLTATSANIDTIDSIRTSITLTAVNQKK